ncbi:unnamed protein product [Durusdinium trenchii]|uniref:Dynein heavy chain tail domain-containing protein n=1 Tax=Durusdinium trenchii TaxID=1381693 RepID=A0ABP0RVN1_9DINO
MQMPLRLPLPKAAASPSSSFPPAVHEADGLLRDLAEEEDKKSTNAARLALSGWSDAILELLAEVERGPNTEDPLEEVWHWLAASERLARALSFAEHFSVAGLASRLDREPEAERWHGAVRQLRMVQRESGWNARYLRVVEEPLARLRHERPEQLSKLVATLLRSLRRIHSSSKLREHRMAALLQKVLKVLVSRACQLPPVFQVGASKSGGAEATHFRDAFQSYLEHYFVNEGAERPAERGEVGFGTPRRGLPGDRAQRSGLSWWRATVRHSRELAESCAQLCGRLAGLLTEVGRLRAALPELHRRDASLMREVQGFLELHSGPRSGLSTAELLDLKRRMEAEHELSEVQARLRDLAQRCEKAGVELSLDAETESVAPTAEVLTLDDQVSVSVPAMQESINCLREELDEMGQQLESFSQLISKKFEPPSRSQVATDSAADEVARRSSWFHPPPPLLPEDVPVIEVQQRISQRVIKRCPSRPRTAQPAMLVMSQAPRPHTAEYVQATTSQGSSPRSWDGDTSEQHEEVSSLKEEAAGDKESDEDRSEALQCSWNIS